MLWALLWMAAVAPSARAEEPVVAQNPESAGEPLDALVARAIEQSPAVRAAYARWEAAVHRVARSRTLPEPTLQFGVFVQSVETRVGPQQARISVAQAFPWPTRLIAGGKSASAEARAAQHRLDATALATAERVESAYWTLWEIRTTRALHQDHLGIVEGLATTARSRLETGAATLADLQQIDLSRARLEDMIRSLDEAEIRALAALRGAIGDAADVAASTDVLPAPATVGESREVLAQAVQAHPGLEGLDERADAADLMARSLGANRMPSLTLGADWVVTGPAVMADTPGSGKDAVMAGVGVKVPLWQGTYAHEVNAARSEADALRSDRASQADLAMAELDRTLSLVRDSGRKMDVVANTLLPQADAAYASVLGNFSVGRSAVADTLLSQRDLLDLGVELARARADHQRAWAHLDQICGREVVRTPVTGSEAP